MRVLLRGTGKHLVRMLLSTAGSIGTHSLFHTFLRNSNRISLTTDEFLKTSTGMPSAPAALSFHMYLMVSSNSCLSNLYSPSFSGNSVNCRCKFSNSVGLNFFSEIFFHAEASSLGLAILFPVSFIDDCFDENDFLVSHNDFTSSQIAFGTRLGVLM